MMAQERLEGRIIEAVSGFYYVDTGSKVYACKARGKFRLTKVNPLVGDLCVIQPEPEDEGFILSIEPRKNELVRPPVANLSQLFLVVSEAPPVTDLYWIDKMTALARYKGIEPVIAVNKCDLHPGDTFIKIYEHAGFPVFSVSARTGEGVAALKAAFMPGLSALAGNSGVGKSSLINRLFPDMRLETADISKKIGRGRHTTRRVTLFLLGGGVYLADTPGFSSLDVRFEGQIRKEELADTFAEFAPFAENCRFTGCAHVKEKDCGVIRAAEEGKIEKSRLISYQALYESMKDQKEWEMEP